MQNLIKFIKSVNIRRILTVFLAGCLLVVSTACSRGNIAQAGGKAYTDTAKRAMSDTYDDYDANQKFQGGMNGYNDDRRYNAETAAKTKALIDRAKSNQNRDLGDYVENLEDSVGDKIEQAQHDIPRTLQANQRKATDYIQDKSEDLTENFSKVREEATKIIDEATSPAQNAMQNANRASERVGNELKSNFEDLT
ncbi:MAG: DUF6658 family protein [Pleurocapsa sp.]